MTTILTGDSDSYVAGNGYSAWNNVWNPGTLINGKDYTQTTTINESTFPNGVSFSWSYPGFAGPPGVYSYPSVVYGSKFGPPAERLNLQYQSIQDLTATYDITISGETGKFNVAFDFFGIPTPDAPPSQVRSEIMMQLHVVDGFNPPTAFTYEDPSSTFMSNVQVTQSLDGFHPEHVGALALSTVDDLSGTLNIGNFVKELLWRGIVDGRNYTPGIEIGSEVVGGTGGMTINSLSYSLTRKQEVHASGTVMASEVGTNRIIGSDGVETVVYSASSTDLEFKVMNGQLFVRKHNDSSTLDVHDAIERIQFGDGGVAFDLSTGQAAGNAVRIIGAAFDANHIIPEFVGIGLQLFDSGMSMLQVSQLALGTQLYLSIAGSTSNEAFVTTVYENVVGAPPSQAERDFYVGLLQGSGGTMTQAELLVLAANADVNAVNINLVGLQQFGVEYV